VVPELSGQQSSASGKATLDFHEEDAFTDFWREAEALLKVALAIQAKEKDKKLPQWLIDAAGDLGRRAWNNVTGHIADTLNRFLKRRAEAGPDNPGPSAGPAERADSASPAAPKQSSAPDQTSSRPTAHSLSGTSYEWGRYVRWDFPNSPDHSRDGLKFILWRGGQGTIGPTGEINAPPEHPADQVCLIRIAASSFDSGSLLACLPGSRRRPVKVDPDNDGGSFRTGSALVAQMDVEDAISATLFGYMRQGALEEARLGLSTLVASLQRDGGVRNPNRDLLAGYVLYKLRHEYAKTWITRIRARYPSIADVHVLAAAQACAMGESDEARVPLNDALENGPPVYTEGVMMLRDTANFLGSMRSEDAALADNVRRASCLAAAANFESTLTCLRLGSDIIVEFVQN